MPAQAAEVLRASLISLTAAKVDKTGRLLRAAAAAAWEFAAGPHVCLGEPVGLRVRVWVLDRSFWRRGLYTALPGRVAVTGRVKPGRHSLELRGVGVARRRAGWYGVGGPPASGGPAAAVGCSQPWLGRHELIKVSGPQPAHDLLAELERPRASKNEALCVRAAAPRSHPFIGENLEAFPQTRTRAFPLVWPE
ncbi:hypothetical protein MAPG_00279 [Magnaporthiopsis poae ATCC 64411]|uniref:Uncharacterized protein n=1 Tax=Magnaporthiopsis poae (strain ATCC 64411 / 73-15) TaxID=644358 RepID=A0A0C4DKK4_MAGP6|nr:hypothetical protein MAPG_00279 [Magnaporthiopsis poae ATCC 64411]